VAADPLGGTVNLEEHPNPRRTEKTALPQVDRDCVVAPPQFLVHGAGEIVGMLGIETARHGQQQRVGGLVPSDRDVHRRFRADPLQGNAEYSRVVAAGPIDQNPGATASSP
jgi:hypothetical protein